MHLNRLNSAKPPKKTNETMDKTCCTLGNNMLIAHVIVADVLNIYTRKSHVEIMIYSNGVSNVKLMGLAVIL